MRVEEREIRNDNGNWKRYGKNSSQGTQRPDKHSQVGLRGHVAVSNSCHSNYCPPQADRNGGKVVIGIVLRPLGVVDEWGEDDDSKYEEKDQQTKDVSWGLKSVYQDLEARRMTGQFE